jgi:hypothetical protein
MKSLRIYVTFASAVFFLFLNIAPPAVAQTPAAPTDAGAKPLTTALRDGQHDFDFAIGTWKTHVSRRLHPLTGSSSWIEFDGTVVTRKVWNGLANLEEIEADQPTGHTELLALRLYNPKSHQWSLNGTSSNEPSLSSPPIGEFKDGRGVFVDQEPFNGRMILVRDVFSEITADSHHMEQAFSDDGGKTWEANWVATLTRVKQ